MKLHRVLSRSFAEDSVAFAVVRAHEFLQNARCSIIMAAKNLASCKNSFSCSFNSFRVKSIVVLVVKTRSFQENYHRARARRAFGPFNRSKSESATPDQRQVLAFAYQSEPRRLHAALAPGALVRTERDAELDMTSAALGVRAVAVVLLLCRRPRFAVRQCERQRWRSRVFVDPGWCPCPGSIPGRV